MKKRFNQNNIIVPNSKKISKTIKNLDDAVRKSIDVAFKRIYKFHSLQNSKIFLI